MKHEVAENPAAEAKCSRHDHAKGKAAAGRNLSFRKELRRNKYIYLLALPAILQIFIFAYLPMVGILIAFQNFNPIRGIFGSRFVGFENFRFFFSGADWARVTFNTLYLNILFITTGTVAALVLAIMLTEVTSRIYVKVTQSLMILPNFIGWPIVSMFAVTLLASDGGLINQILAGLGLPAISFYSDPSVWPATFVLIRIWKGAGFSAIIYMAVIIGLDRNMYEAARIDGATRLQCIFRITLPLLKNTIILLLILSVGHIFRGDMGMIYTFIGDNPLLYPTTDVIDTYVFRALRTTGSMGMTTAVGLYQSIIGFILVVLTNRLARRHSAEAAIF